MGSNASKLPLRKDQSTSKCHTRGVKHHCSLTWTIDDFSMFLTTTAKETENDKTSKFILSSHFAPPTAPGYRFQLMLYPNGDKRKGQVSLFLIRIADDGDKDSDDEITVQYKFSIIPPPKTSIIYSLWPIRPAAGAVFNSKQPGWGWSNFVPHTTLKWDKLLGPEDRLVIKAEVSFLDGITTTKDKLPPQTLLVGLLNAQKS